MNFSTLSTDDELRPDENIKFALKHDVRLDRPTNPAELELLHNSQDINRLKRRRQYKY